MKLEHLFMPLTRINSKWIQDLNIRPETVKIIEENISSKISDIAHNNILLLYLPRQGNKRKSKQMGLYQTKKFLHGKGKHQQNKKTTY